MYIKYHGRFSEITVSHRDLVEVTLCSHCDLDKATFMPNMHYINRILLQILRNIKNRDTSMT